MNRKVLLYILLGLLPVVGIYNFMHFRKGKGVAKKAQQAPLLKKGKAEKQEEAKKEEKKPPPPPAAISFDDTRVDLSDVKKRMASGQWGRNPFHSQEDLERLSRPTVTLTPSVEVAPPPLVELTLESVLISDTEKVAVIDKEIYSEGDLIPSTGEKVAGITTEGVMLEGADGTKRLVRLKQSPVKLRTRVKE